MLYFSYGSNMSSLRLRNRTQSASSKGVAKLYGHVLAFHKKSDKDGSGKCDAYETFNNDDIVHGVTYKIDEREISTLDRIEGLGYGYEKKAVTVMMESGEQISAFTYYAMDIDAALQPFCWYKEHVVCGAVEHGLPQDYTAALKAVEHMDDHDASRVEKELSIYRLRQRS